METLIVIACNREITRSGPARNALPKCTRAAASASAPAEQRARPAASCPGARFPAPCRGPTRRPRYPRVRCAVAQNGSQGAWRGAQPRGYELAAAAGARGVGRLPRGCR
ncbi:neuropeptide Y receptor type 5 isoform X2 [Coturnix japonica]|uniref:neuropeptide Y receptor type 5 isoform X2 n=1 Tax=Coturnix japonica TaxID=93934 RepID=UPI000777D1FF|nr:neuropeptide Y receptor type 5 isoform X2 [Coturnix japonica]